MKKFICLLILLTNGIGFSQDDTTGELQGVVFNTSDESVMGNVHVLNLNQVIGTITDENGQFAIFGVPVGNYEVEFWHEKLGRLSRTVAVEEKHSSVLDVVFTSP